MEEIYKQQILDLARNPLNKGILSEYDATYRDFSTSCGDEITVYLKFEGGKVTGVMHDSHGCAISQAAVSLLTDAVKGKTKEEVLAMNESDMLKLLGISVTANRMSCAMLGFSTLRKALKEQGTKNKEQSYVGD